MIRFGPFLLDPLTRQLWRDNQLLKIEKIPFDILLLLIQHRDRIVSRDEIAEAVWGRDRFVEAADGINTAIRKIRRALDDSTDEPQYLRTFFGRGYQFLAPIQDGTLSPPDSPTPAPSPQLPPPPPLRPKTLAIVAATILIAASLAIWLGFRHPQPPQSSATPPAIVRLTSDTGFTGWPDLSPDGKLIAYASNRASSDNQDLYIQPVAGGPAHRLTFEPEADTFPNISPNADQIVFQSLRQPPGIYTIPLFGGPARLLARGGYRPRYSPNGQWILYGHANSCWIIPAAGGAPRQLRPELSSSFPIWAGNDHIIFLAQSNSHTLDWWLTPRDGSWAKPLGAFPLFDKQPRADFPDSWQSFRTPDFFHNNSVVFRVRTRDGANLWSLRFSPDWKPLSLHRLTSMTDHVREPAASSSGGIAAAVVSRNIDIFELPLDANTATINGKLHRLTSTKGSEQFVSASADGALVSYTAWRNSDHGDIFLLDRRSGVERQLTATPEKEAHGRLSPDGRALLFGRWHPNGNPDFLRLSLPSGNTQTLCSNCENVDFAPDSASYFFTESSTKRLLFASPSNSSPTEPVHDDNWITSQASLHPSGRWLAFVAFQSTPADSPRKIFIAPFRPNARLPHRDWIEIAAGQTPLWSPNGQWLYYDTPHGSYSCLAATQIDPSTAKPTRTTSIAHIHGDQQLISAPFFKDRGLAHDRIVFSTMEMLSNIWLIQ